MPSRLSSSLISIAVITAYVIAVWSGPQFGIKWSYWGAVVSGFLWLLASLIPTWNRQALLAPAVLNSTAAAAAVFAGLSALPAETIPY